jgi:hypothetical protein
MNRPVLALGITVELLASAPTVLSAPTDVHPSIRTFLLEHALIWAFVFAILIKLAIATPQGRFSSPLQTALACLLAELVSTCCAWFIIPSDLSHINEVCREWFGGFENYFLRRFTIWCVMAALALLVYRFMLGRGAKRVQLPD